MSKKQAKGFNSVLSCPNCNKFNIKNQHIEISHHEFMNSDEFTDKALLEELIIRTKKGCIEIKKEGKDFVFEEECRWNLARGMKKDEKTGKIVQDENAEGNYTISLKELLDFQNNYRKLEDDKKICNLCLERKLSPDDKMFCKICWKREEKAMKLRSKINKHNVKNNCNF
ncbi:MAG: hypothetical protein mread185_000406 [Mycoplasmataceae bacterium]|nr:MAG: hypothetical protein mread185_000406 [Mycoplasmataceae bacterium]